MRAGAPPERRPGWLATALAAGFAAGTLATVAQLVLWWAADEPVAQNLWRDARLTAALVMGKSVLPPPATPRGDVLLVATLIHFGLSAAYAALAVPVCDRLRGVRAPLAGALYGLLIYAINLYGMTYCFPWFIAVRDGVTLAAHVVFGLTLAAACAMLRGRGCDVAAIRSSALPRTTRWK